MSHQDWSRGVVRVGDGRGFVIEHDEVRYVVTAAHCLPELPPAHFASRREDRTYAGLLAPLGEEPTVWGECLFVDPVLDVAVLDSPDSQELDKQADAYDELVSGAVPLPVGSLTFARKPPLPPLRGGMTLPDAGLWEVHVEVFVLTLTGLWTSVPASGLGRTRRGGKCLWFDDFTIEGGMSGSPILTADGKAVGVIGSTAAQSLLMAALPGWLICP
jgi:hypothetical protein